MEKLLLRRCSTVESPVSVPGFCPRPWFLSLIYRPLGGGNEGISNQQQPLHRTAPGDPPKKKLVPKGILSTCFSHLGWVLNAIFIDLRAPYYRGPTQVQVATVVALGSY